ncbi:MAG: hypothetical protein RBU21_00345 [FCB group bacterium]|jgi:hypothetical protein|nr:hypothetical protein [FCB group bacterium]
MIEFVVSLDIVASISITDSELAKRFGLAPSALNHKKMKRGKCWRYEPTANEGMTLVDKIGLVAAGICPEHPPILLDETIIAVILMISVFQDGAACTTYFPVRCLDSLRQSIPELAVDVTCHVVSEANPHPSWRQ